MKILLDENFPLKVYYQLEAKGFEVEHIILLSQRGIPDTNIRQRLKVEELLFLTHDSEFVTHPSKYKAVILLSRVAQNKPISERTQLITKAIEQFISQLQEVSSVEKLFEINTEGEVRPIGE